MKADTLKRRYLREDEQAIDNAILALLKHYEGRKFLWWCLQMGKVGAQPFTGNALTTAFGCGELNIGNQFLERITSVSPEGYVTMMKEMADERTKRDTELAGADGTYDSEPDYGASDAGGAEAE